MWSMWRGLFGLVKVGGLGDVGGCSEWTISLDWKKSSLAEFEARLHLF